MHADAPTLLLPDAGPLITLAYAQALDLLLKPGWPVQIVDMVLHEVTRNQTPTSATIAAWVRANAVAVLPTQTMAKQLFAGARFRSCAFRPPDSSAGKKACTVRFGEVEVGRPALTR